MGLLIEDYSGSLMQMSVTVGRYGLDLTHRALWIGCLLLYSLFMVCAGFWGLLWYGIKRGMLTGDVRIGVVIAAPYISSDVYSLHSAFIIS